MVTQFIPLKSPLSRKQKMQLSGQERIDIPINSSARRITTNAKQSSPSAANCFIHWKVWMLDQHSVFWMVNRVIRWLENNQYPILVNQPVDDMLDKRLLFIKLSFCLDVLLPLLHVPTDQILLSDHVAFLFLLSQISRKHCTYSLIVCIGDLHFFWGCGPVTLTLCRCGSWTCFTNLRIQINVFLLCSAKRI